MESRISRRAIAAIGLSVAAQSMFAADIDSPSQAQLGFSIEDVTVSPSLQPSPLQNEHPQLHAVVLKTKLWEPGTVLKVCFYGDDPDANRLVADTSVIWTKHANVALDFGEADSLRKCESTTDPIHIRVGFNKNCNGNWSLVGNESIDPHVLARAPECAYPRQSMNIPAVYSSDSKEQTRTILHEFGHALGFRHEHQNPQGGCTEDILWERLYFELRSSAGWGKQKVDLNFRAYPDSTAYWRSSFDPESIMIYRIPVQFLKSGSSCAISVEPWQLSIADQQAASEMYPQDLYVALRSRLEEIEMTLAYYASLSDKGVGEYFGESGSGPYVQMSTPVGSVPASSESEIAVASALEKIKAKAYQYQHALSSRDALD